MSEIHHRLGPGLVAPIPRHCFNLLSFATVFLAALLIGSGPVRAQSPDDEYMKVFNLIQDADGLHKGGKVAPALAKYREGFNILQQLKNENPRWNSDVVGFRLKYLSSRIAALTEELSAPPPKAASDAGAGGKAAAQVKLIEAGSEPRKQLRLNPKVGSQQTVALTLKSDTGVKTGGAGGQSSKMPATTVNMKVTVTGVSPEGDISYEVLMDDAEVSAEPGVAPEVVDAIKAVVGSLKGTSGKGTVSSRGLAKGVEFKAPADASPPVVQAVGQVKDFFAAFGAVFPEEPLGPGAKWETQMTLTSQGLSIDQTCTYELVSVEGERVAMKRAAVQRAPNQKVRDFMVPGATVEITRMEGKGTGTLSLDLAQLMPTEAKSQNQSEFNLNVEMGGQKQTVTMTVNSSLQIESKAP